MKFKEKLRIFLFDLYLKRFIKQNFIRTKESKIKEALNQLVFGEEDDSDYSYECEDSDGYEPIAADVLDEMIEKLKKPTFTEELIRLIRESGRKDSAIYKAADIDKRLFSKIMSDFNYKPSKDTAIALALSLRLSPSEMTDLISRAGYTLTHSSKRDLIIEFFFQNKQYSLIELNDTLYRFKEKPLGRTK